jgi:hypothetical protein
MAQGQKMPSSDRLETPEGRASYAFVFTPRTNDAGDPQYSLTLLIPKTSEQAVRVLKDAAIAVGQQAFGPTFADQVRAGRLRWPFRDGDKEKPDDPVYAGHWFLNMRNSNKPQIVDRHLQEILSPENFGSGDYCKVTGRFFAYDSKGNKGVSFSLGNIQKVRSGERLDNRVDARKEFSAYDGPDPGAGNVGSSGTATGYDDL